MKEQITYLINGGEFTADKLLPCPFCGGEPDFIAIGNDYAKKRSVEIRCTSCMVRRTIGAIRQNLEWCGLKAIEAWNTRYQLPTIKDSLQVEPTDEEIEGVLLKTLKEIYSQADSYHVRLNDKKTNWVLQYTNDYPLQHGKGKTYIIPKEVIDALIKHRTQPPQEDKVVIEKWKFEEIWNAIRATNNTYHCFETKTAFDRMVNKAWGYVEEVRKQNKGGKDERIY